MQINISWGTGAAAAPGAFQTAVRDACDYWCSVLTNPVTVNLKFDWARLGAGGLAQTMFGYITAPYGTVRNALVANATTPDGVIAAAALPGGSPFSSPSVALSNAQARMLGLSAGTTDGTITLGSNVAWTFDPNNRAVGGAQDAIGALEHEISEALGRYAGFDTSLGAAGTPAVLNFFRRNAAGGIDASQTFQNDYFSLDGVHLLAPMGEAGGDWADWGAGVYGDSFGYGYTGMASLVTAVDLQSMSAIGWKVAANAAQTITNNGGLFHATGAQVQMQARLYGTLQGDANQINMGAGAILTINGASNSVAAAANAVVALAGGGNSVAAASGVQVQAGGNGAGGASNVVSGSGVSATLAAGARMDVIGANNTVSAGASANFGVWGGGNRVTASAGDGVWTGGNGVGGVSNTISGAGVSITLSANSRMDVYGAGNVISAGANAMFGVVGAGNQVSLSTGDALWIGGNGVGGVSNRVTGSGASINLLGTARMDVWGSNNTISAGVGSILGVLGAGNRITAAAGDGVWIGGNGAGGVSNVVTGSGAAVTQCAGSRMDLQGAGDVAWIGDGCTTGIWGTGHTVTAGAGDGVWLSGSNHTLIAGFNDSVYDGGVGTLIKAGSNVGVLRIANFAMDATSILDLLNGVGGYTTAQQCFAALTSDGAGGCQLSLGAAGTVDFVGTSASQLSAAHFKIG